MLITAAQSITFFPSEAAALELMAKGEDMNEANGFRVVPSTARPGKFVIEVFDVEDGFVHGNI